jgi:hypothetical protein
MENLLNCGYERNEKGLKIQFEEIDANYITDDLVVKISVTLVLNREQVVNNINKLIGYDDLKTLIENRR